MSSEIQQNWQNFLQHHALGDWHGTWIFYSSEGDIVKFFKCIRSFKTNSDGTKIYHQNHYFYDDNTTETKTFEPYQVDTTTALFLENSFSWGSPIIETNSKFFFETGYQHENRRASVVVTYDDKGKLEKIIAIPEQLGAFVDSNSDLIKVDKSNWHGEIQAIAPNKITTVLEETNWKALEDLDKNDLILYLLEGISLCCPLQLKSEKETFFVIDWQATSSVLYRGTRHYNSSGFSHFTLQTFMDK